MNVRVLECRGDFDLAQEPLAADHKLALDPVSIADHSRQRTSRPSRRRSTGRSRARDDRADGRWSFAITYTRMGKGHDALRVA